MNSSDPGYHKSFTGYAKQPVNTQVSGTEVSWSEYYQKLARKEYVTQIVSRLINNIPLSSEEKNDLLTYVANSRFNFGIGSSQIHDMNQQQDCVLLNYLTDKFKIRCGENPAKFVQLLESEQKTQNALLAQYKQAIERLEDDGRILRLQIQEEKQRFVQIVKKLEKRLQETRDKYMSLKEQYKQVQLEKARPAFDFNDIANVLKQKEDFITQLKNKSRSQKFKLMSQIVQLGQLIKALKNALNEAPSEKNNMSLSQVHSKRHSAMPESPKQDKFRRMQSQPKNDSRGIRDDTLSMGSLDQFMENKGKFDVVAIETVMDEIAQKRSLLESMSRINTTEQEKRLMFASAPGVRSSLDRQTEQYHSIKPSSIHQDDLREEINILFKRLEFIGSQVEVNMKLIETKILSCYKKYKTDELLNLRDNQKLFQKFEHISKYLSGNDITSHYFELLSIKSLIDNAKKSDAPMADKLARESRRPEQIIEEELTKQKCGFYEKEKEFQSLKTKVSELKDINEYLMKIVRSHEATIEQLREEMDKERLRLTPKSQPPIQKTGKTIKFGSANEIHQTERQLESNFNHFPNVFSRNETISKTTIPFTDSPFEDHQAQVEEPLMKAYGPKFTFTKYGPAYLHLQQTNSNLQNCNLYLKHQLSLKNSALGIEQYLSQLYFDAIKNELTTPRKSSVKAVLANLKRGNARQAKDDWRIKYSEVEKQLSFAKNEIERLNQMLKTNSDSFRQEYSRIQFDKQNLSTQLSQTLADKSQAEMDRKTLAEKYNQLVADFHQKQNEFQSLEKYIRGQENLASQKEAEKSTQSTAHQTEIDRLKTEMKKLSAIVQNNKEAMADIEAAHKEEVEDLQSLIRSQEHQINALIADNERYIASIRMSVQNNEAISRRTSRQETAEMAEKLKTQEVIFKRFTTKHTKDLDEVNQQVSLLEDRVVKLTINLNNIVSRNSLTFSRRSELFKKELLKDWLQARLDTLKETVFSKLSESALSTSNINKVRREKLETIRKMLNDRDQIIEDYQSFVFRVKDLVGRDDRSENIELILRKVEGLNKFKQIVTEMNSQLNLQITENSWEGEIKKLHASRESCVVFQNMFGDWPNENASFTELIEKLYIIKQKTRFYETISGITQEPIDLMDDKSVERFAKNYEHAMKLCSVISKALNKSFDQVTPKELENCLSGKAADSQHDVRSQRGAFSRNVLGDSFILDDGESQNDPKVKLIIEKYNEELKKAKASIENMTLENNILTDKFFKYQEEIYSLKEELEQKNQELNELRESRNNAENRNSSSNNAEKTKIKNMQANIKNLEKSLEVAKTIFDALGLSMKDKDLKEKFNEKINQLKSSPGPIQLEFQSRKKTPPPYYLHNIDEDKYNDDNLSISKSNIESQNDIEIKTFNQNFPTKSRNQTKSYSDQNKVMKKNYFITSFMNYDKGLKNTNMFDIGSIDRKDQDNDNKRSYEHDTQEDRSMRFNN